MSDNQKGFYSAATYLGQDHRISQGILKLTACMGIDERVLLADLEFIKEIYPILNDVPNMDVPDLIDKVLKPMIANEGFAKWQRDVVTDMAIKKGESTKGGHWKKKGKTETADDAETEDDDALEVALFP